jgi:hypothetical protein
MDFNINSKVIIKMLMQNVVTYNYTGYGRTAEGPEFECGNARLFLALRRPDRCCGPSNLLSNGIGTLSSGGKAAEA